MSGGTKGTPEHLLPGSKTRNSSTFDATNGNGRLGMMGKAPNITFPCFKKPSHPLLLVFLASQPKLTGNDVITGATSNSG